VDCSSIKKILVRAIVKIRSW